MCVCAHGYTLNIHRRNIKKTMMCPLASLVDEITKLLSVFQASCITYLCLCHQEKSVEWFQPFCFSSEPHNYVRDNTSLSGRGSWGSEDLSVLRRESDQSFRPSATLSRVCHTRSRVRSHVQAGSRMCVPWRPGVSVGIFLFGSLSLLSLYFFLSFVVVVSLCRFGFYFFFVSGLFWWRWLADLG